MIWNVSGTPLQLPTVGVTTMVAGMGVALGLSAVKFRRLPVPFAGKPIAVLELLQAKVAPTVPMNVTATGVLGQGAKSWAGIIPGNGETLMANVWAGPVQPLASEGVTVTVALSAAGAVAAVKDKLPEPEAGNPMAGLSFVQV